MKIFSRNNPNPYGTPEIEVDDFFKSFNVSIGKNTNFTELALDCKATDSDVKEFFADEIEEYGAMQFLGLAGWLDGVMEKEDYEATLYIDFEILDDEKAKKGIFFIESKPHDYKTAEGLQAFLDKSKKDFEQEYDCVDEGREAYKHWENYVRYLDDILHSKVACEVIDTDGLILEVEFNDDEYEELKRVHEKYMGKHCLV